LVHGDWYRTSVDHPYVIVWLDDASRYVIVDAMFSEATMEHRIDTFKMVIRYSGSLHTFVKDANTDRGSQFYSNHPKSISAFQEFLKRNGMRHVPSRRNKRYNICTPRIKKQEKKKKIGGVKLTL
jgi:hypothetical protein